MDTAWTEEGIFGSALRFNGTSSYVELPHDGIFDFNSSGAIEFWLKLPPEAEASTQGWIIGKGCGWDRAGWSVTTIYKNRLRFQWQSVVDIGFDSLTALEYEKWYHIAAVYDGHMLRFYINGEGDPHFMIVDKLSAATEDSVRIGMDDLNLLPFRGIIDEIRIHNNLSLSKSLGFYGVKYILVNSDPEYYQTLKEYGMIAQKDWAEFLLGDTDESLKAKIPFWIDRDEVLDLEETLAVSSDFAKVYSDQNVRVYENLQYEGNVFPVKLEPANPPNFFNYQLSGAKVTYSTPGMNRVVVNVENREPVWLMVSQNYHDGWVADIKTTRPDGTVIEKQLSIQKKVGIQCLAINEAGTHKITLRYEHYRSSLTMFLCFYLLVLPGVFFAWRQDRKEKINSRSLA